MPPRRDLLGDGGRTPIDLRRERGIFNHLLRTNP
jgi:hypothetical protein